MGLSPAWAFSGQAIDAVGDAHLAPGMHYRVLTNPLLGLPVVPLVIGKIRLGQMAKGFTRRDITWIDSHGTILTTPFHRHARQPGHRPPARGPGLLLGGVGGPGEQDRARTAAVPVPGPTAHRGQARRLPAGAEPA